MIIDSLLVALGFEVDTGPAQQWIDKAKDAETAALGFVGAIVALAGAIGVATIAMAGELDEVGDFADLNSVAATSVLELGFAAQLSGGDIDALKSSVQGLNRVAGEAALGIGRGAKLFATMGLSARNASGEVKSFDELLLDIADKMQGLSTQEQIALASKLGIDPTLVPLLRKGREEIEALRQEFRDFGGATDADIAAAGELTDEIDRLKAMATATGQAIGLFFLPIVKETVGAFREWWVANRQLVRDNLTTSLQFLTNLLSVVFDWLRRLGGVVNWLVDLIGGWRTVLLAAGAALTILVSAQTLKLLTSFVAVLNYARTAIWGLVAGIGIVPILVAAAAAAIFLLIDDVVNFAEGNDSVIGRLVERFPAFAEFIRKVAYDLNEFWQQMTAAFEGLSPRLVELANSLGGLFSVLWDLLSPVLGAILQLVGFLLPIVLLVIEKIVVVITTLLTGLLQAVTVVANLLVSTLTGVISILTDAFAGFFNMLIAGWDRVVKTIGGAVSAVKGWLGLGSGDAVPVAGATGAASSGGLPTPQPTQKNGVLGPAASPAGTTGGNTNTTNVQVGAPNITIQTTDPQTAGQSVVDALDKMNRGVIRDNQSSVAL
jgi:hypothetical protein